MPPEDADPAAKCPVDPQTREKWLEAARAKGQQTVAHPPQVTEEVSRWRSLGWLWKATKQSKEEDFSIVEPLAQQKEKERPTARRAQDVPRDEQPRTTVGSPSAEQLRKAEHDPNLLRSVRDQILQMPQEQRAILLVQYEELKATERLHQLGRTRYSLDRRRWEANMPNPIQNKIKPSEVQQALSTHREISSIPRALPTNHDRQVPNSAEAAAMPANSERDTGHDRDSGNWIYPSQEMFFAAMKRKGHNPESSDMSTIVPIHNAVNERAWAEIKAWESGRGSEKCGGPKLVSFAGDSKALTPRARWNALMGYEQPFDRHDWVVDRCGSKVDYVIDFYSGKEEGLMGGKGLNFYLDVRPKLNSWAGISTRMASAVGM